MENDPTFQWTKLFLDHLWLVFPLIAVGYLILNPKILRNITSLKVGDFEVKLDSIKAEIHATREATQRLAESHSHIEKLIAGINIDGSVAELRQASQALKDRAGYLGGGELVEGLAGLQPGANAAALHAAAVIARKRVDPSALTQIVDCLDRLTSSRDLAGVRLNTVWQLASAVHLTLVAIYKRGASPAPERALLERAETVFNRLIAHGRVQNDRSDDPKKGVRGPAGNALRWIGIGLAKHKD